MLRRPLGGALLAVTLMLAGIVLGAERKIRSRSAQAWR